MPARENKLLVCAAALFYGYFWYETNYTFSFSSWWCRESQIRGYFEAASRGCEAAILCCIVMPLMVCCSSRVLYTFALPCYARVIVVHWKLRYDLSLGTLPTSPDLNLFMHKDTVQSDLPWWGTVFLSENLLEQKFLRLEDRFHHSGFLSAEAAERLRGWLYLKGLDSAATKGLMDYGP